MKKLTLAHYDYKNLHKELNVAHEMKHAKDNGYGVDMRGFITQLNNAVKKNAFSHTFRVTCPVADALASSEHKLTETFSYLYMEMTLDRVKARKA